MMNRILCWYAPLHFAAALDTGAAVPRNKSNQRNDVAAAVLSLQIPHAKRTPSSVLTSLANDCRTLGISTFDVYGDFDKSTTADSDSSSLYLRQFEHEVATDFGMDDAVFMPSGVMAQSIALLIHGGFGDDGERRTKFVCHESSHLLLHEHQAYKHLLHMDPIVITTTPAEGENSFRSRPLEYKDVTGILSEHDHDDNDIGTLILELPHRELGGKCTSWDDVLKMRHYCDTHDIKFHCDGARIFEATAGYDDKSMKELAKAFDSVYISFYKGLGGLSGAMLLGSVEFCQEARVWLRRFGGNLYTLLPYAVSGWSGYRKHFVNATMTFRDKQRKMARVVEFLCRSDQIRSHVSFDPTIPQVNMVHGYLFASTQECLNAIDAVEEQTNIRVLSRIRNVEESDPAFRHGYRSKFEWTIGDANGAINDYVFRQGWDAFVSTLDASKTR